MALQWNDGIADKLKEAAYKRLIQATDYLHSQLLQVLNVPNSGERRKRMRDTAAGKKGSSYTVYPHPAKRGDPPRKRTGWLQRHVQYRLERSALRTVVGLGRNAPYGLTHELRHHPWFRRTIKRLVPRLRAIVEGGKGP